MFSLDVRRQSVSKEFDNSNLNEDQLRLSENFIALADGAGGTGILCGEWAEFLLNKIPEQPIKTFENFKDWLEQNIDCFLETFEPIVSKDNFKMRRFYEEGSASTLAVVWQKGNKFHWITYGDSHVFILNKNRLQTFPHKSAADFERGTYLLNWTYQPNEAGFNHGTCSKTCSFLLATDAISKHIFEKYIDPNGKSEPIPLDELFEVLDTEQSFITYIKSEPTIPSDDYTMIVAIPYTQHYVPE